MLERSPLDDAHGEYSDTFKMIYGFRPRLRQDLTLEELNEMNEEISVEAQRYLVQQKQKQIAAIAQFEADVAKCIQLGAADREAAIRWIAEGDEAGHDREYLCYRRGLPYGYFNDQSAVMAESQSWDLLSD